MIIGDAALVLLVAVLLGWGASVVGNRRRQSLAMRVPPTLGSHDGVELNQASTYYRLARRMAHELEALLLQDEQLPFMQDRRREAIHTVLDEWDSN